MNGYDCFRTVTYGTDNPARQLTEGSRTKG
jgi:hypothetical protein